MKLLLLWQISNNHICITMKAIRTGLVSKLKPSAVRVYDYYEPGRWNLCNIFIIKHYIMQIQCLYPLYLLAPVLSPEHDLQLLAVGMVHKCFSFKHFFSICKVFVLLYLAFTELLNLYCFNVQKPYYEA